MPKMPCPGKNTCPCYDCNSSLDDITLVARAPTNTPTENGVLVNVTSNGAICEDGLVEVPLAHHVVVGRGRSDSISEPKLGTGQELALLPKIIRNFSLVGKVCVVTG